MTSTLIPMTTPVPSTTNSTLLAQTVELLIWRGSLAGTIIGTLLIGLGLVFTVVLCRKRQIRKEQLIREHLYYTIGDRPPKQPAVASAENTNDQPITLTNYVNLPQVEPATKPIDIPGTTRNVADTITNSAYSAGIHYDRIPGEPDSKPPSAASEHVYSVIKDEASAKKKATAVQPAQKQQQKQISKPPFEDQAELMRAKKGARTLGALAEPVDMESEGFIELLPRNVQAYDLLKREGHQEIQELSLLLTSGTYDQLLSPDEEPAKKDKNKKEYVFNPYSGDSDDESPTSQDDMNPYDDTVGVKAQMSSLQAITNGQNAGSGDKNDPSVNSRKLDNKPSITLKVDQSSDSEMIHAYDAIDELQKQIHILSQSIPTLDLYGYEDLDKVKPTPKASRSIPVLDVAGYEDLDAMKPAQKQAVPKKEPTKMNYADLGFDTHFYESIKEKKGRHSLGAALDIDENPPSVPARTIESMYTAVKKKPKSSTIAAHGATGQNKNKKLEEFYSPSKKSSSTIDLFEAPPPVPPLTVEALYTEVQKPKKSSTAKNNVMGKGASPPLPPKGEIEENSPTVPPKTVASMYTAVQKRPKAKKATDTEAPTFEFEEVPPPIPPKTVEEAYLAAQKVGKIPPIPPRAHERVYSGVYRHKEDKQTVL